MHNFLPISQADSFYEKKKPCDLYLVLLDTHWQLKTSVIIILLKDTLLVGSGGNWNIEGGCDNLKSVDPGKDKTLFL